MCTRYSTQLRLLIVNSSRPTPVSTSWIMKSLRFLAAQIKKPHITTERISYIKTSRIRIQSGHIYICRYDKEKMISPMICALIKEKMISPMICALIKEKMISPMVCALIKEKMISPIGLYNNGNSKVTPTSALAFYHYEVLVLISL